MKRLLVVGNDKVGRALVARLPSRSDITVVFDASSNLGRIFRLVKRGSLSPVLLLKMAWAEWMRSNQPSPAAQSISSNQDLLQLIQALKPRQVFLFRAGLIINRQVIGAGADILNVHCAKVPEYGGLGSIARALADKAYEQHATLHRVTARIDEGEVLAVEPYRLDARLSYRRNEEIAYEAGIRLLTRELGGP